MIEPEHEVGIMNLSSLDAVSAVRPGFTLIRAHALLLRHSCSNIPAAAGSQADPVDNIRLYF